ncbi:MAG: hypothetical protein H5T86_05250, partial [Armatimonadetes bacterium]|nr:hypothetical protein [Armatimonadota bacterium]
RLPFIVMPAGTPQDLRKRLKGAEGTPEELAEHLRMILECAADGHCDGMVIYCLPKSPGNEWFKAAQQVIAEMKPRLAKPRQ